MCSHHTASGWYPQVRLNVAAAFSLSECTRKMVASTSSTITSAGRTIPPPGPPPDVCSLKMVSREGEPAGAPGP